VVGVLNRTVAIKLYILRYTTRSLLWKVTMPSSGSLMCQQ